ncbi:MAG: serine/threonine-protein kinase [Candidatus Dormibacteria bacterium]
MIKIRRPRSGDVQAGGMIAHFRVDGLLGTGATSTVYRATDTELEREVALKQLRPELAADGVYLDRFRREARLLSEVDSPNCVRVFDLVEAPEGIFLVTELVRGATLRQVLASSRRLTPEQALAVTRGSLLGLGDAHRRGLVHGDVKPENILVAADGTSKLADFGAVAEAGGDSTVATTPAYLSPEQISGAPADPRSDIYACGVVLYELLCGRPPFRPDNVMAAMHMHLRGEVPDPRTLVPDLPEPVARVVLKALATNPAARYPDVAAFVTALEVAATAAYGVGWHHRGAIKVSGAGIAGASAAGGLFMGATAMSGSWGLAVAVGSALVSIALVAGVATTLAHNGPHQDAIRATPAAAASFIGSATGLPQAVASLLPSASASVTASGAPSSGPSATASTFLSPQAPGAPAPPPGGSAAGQAAPAATSGPPASSAPTAASTTPASTAPNWNVASMSVQWFQWDATHHGCTSASPSGSTYYYDCRYQMTVTLNTPCPAAGGCTVNWFAYVSATYCDGSTGSGDDQYNNHNVTIPQGQSSYFTSNPLDFLITALSGSGLRSTSYGAGKVTAPNVTFAPSSSVSSGECG